MLSAECSIQKSLIYGWTQYRKEVKVAEQALAGLKEKNHKNRRLSASQ